MKLLFAVLMVPLMSLSCQKKNELEKLKDFSEEIEEQTKEPLPLPVLSELIRQQSMDKDQPVDYKQLSKEQLAMKKDGIECVTCDINAEDPNMRPEGFRGY